MKAEKYDYSSAKDAHWRIDELAEVVNGLTEVVGSHSEDLAGIKRTFDSIKVSLYTLAGVIVAAELGVFGSIKLFLGL